MTHQATQTKPLLQVSNVQKFFPIRRGFLRRHVGDVKAVDDVTFEIHRGETLGLVGESGCGKTTLGRLLLRALEPTSGRVIFRKTDEDEVDVTALGYSELRELRRHMQLVFQDPFSSLNPRMMVREIIGEPLLCYGMRNLRERSERVAELLKLVGLNTGYMSRFPHAFSGGQRQRIGVARAIALNPDLIIADEAVSALDVSVQAQILNLLEDIQERLSLTYLFISHDLGVIEHVCDRVIVMYVGQIVEVGRTQEIFQTPKHPYVEALLSAVPRPDPSYKLEEYAIKGEVADPANRPKGCPFHPRCPYAQSICGEEAPVLKLTGGEAETRTNHAVACHFSDKLELRGVVNARKLS